ncbi:hypothetical protein ACE6ED_27385 [Paenibacillus sp. CN-4]|uniref:hypothetical protein n=1 Tax=Paenibacillus nanchangensis TaxID=3348343 RepID=UPI00397B9920
MMNFTLTMVLIAVLLSGCPSIDKLTAEGKEGKEVATAIPQAEKTEQVQNVSYIQSFVDNSNGWRVQIRGQGMFKAENTLNKTTDGGLTWQKVSDSRSGNLPNEPITGMIFTSLDRGWITVTSPREGKIGLYRTDNGGKRWTDMKLRGKDNLAYTVELPVFFSTTSYGLIRVKDNKTAEDSTLFFITKDNGDSWKSITSDDMGLWNEMEWKISRGQSRTTWEIKIDNKSWKYNGTQWTKKS